MSRWDTVSIIGVGLIGGSIGLALRHRHLAEDVVGVGRRESSLRKALQRGVVTSTTTDIRRGVAQAQLVVVCTPVADIVQTVRQAASACPGDTTITDVGSTKTHIVEALEGPGQRGVGYVGSHPLAGSEKTGAEFAQGDLFEDRTVVVTPTDKSVPHDVATIEEFWRSLGARVIRMAPDLHDEALAATSHVPHLVASALAACVDKDNLALVAGGWLDTTRVASGDVQLWEQILRENRRHVLPSLDQFAKVLTAFRVALENDDAERLVQLLEVGKRNRDTVGN